MRSHNNRWRLGRIVCLMLACAAAARADGHPFHISLAEMEYDQPSDRIQVSLRLQAVDLERVLQQTAGHRVRIEQPQTQPQIIDFLEQNFFLSAEPADAQSLPTDGGLAVRQPTEVGAPQTPVALPPTDRRLRSRVHWVGYELKGAWLWLYFELELPSPYRSLRLTNTVLFDSNPNQINTVSVRHGAQRTTLKMSAQEQSAKFESQWLKRE